MTAPLFVSIDGFDGAGKSTLAAGLEAALTRRGVRVAVVDRTLPRSTPTIDALAHAIKRSDGGIEPLDPLSDALLRAACGRERLAVGADADVDVVLLDRWLAWDLSRTDDEAYALTRTVFAEIVRHAGDLLAILLDIDFETAWARVERRGGTLSPRELLGPDHNRALHARLPVGRARLRECGAAVTTLDARLRPADVLARALALVEARRSESADRGALPLRTDDVA